MAVSISLILQLGGCGKPTLTVLVLDNSISCATYTQKWTKEFIPAMAGNAAIETSEIAIVQINANPSLRWSGRGTRVAEFKAELRQAVQPALKPGSDVYGALELVREICARPEFHSASIKIVIVSDLKVYGSKFKDPLKFKEFPKDAEIVVYGLSAEKSKAVREAWKQFQVRTFLRNSRFESANW